MKHLSVKRRNGDAPDSGPDLRMEIGHVLFLDIVGYSKRLTNEQHALIDRLNQVVRQSDEFQRAEAAGRLVKTLDRRRDGAGLLQSPEQPPSYSGSE